MTVSALITQGIGPGGSILLLLTDGLSIGGVSPDILIDTHDGGKEHRKRQKLIKDERERRERARAAVIASFEHIIEGRPIISEDVASDVLAVIEETGLQPDFDFRSMLNSVKDVNEIWKNYLEKDDEDVLLLL